MLKTFYTNAVVSQVKTLYSNAISDKVNTRLLGRLLSRIQNVIKGNQGNINLRCS